MPIFYLILTISMCTLGSQWFKNIAYVCCGLVSISHRYRNSKIDCLRFVMCPLLAPVFQGFFFVVAINSTNVANKASGTRL
jgi:hypothetical protein